MECDRADNMEGGGRWQKQEREGVVAVEASIHIRNVVVAPIGEEKKMWREEVSPPASGSTWTDWSHAWGGEMHLKRALEKLNLEYPADSD
jgi:hypothetical protein